MNTPSRLIVWVVTALVGTPLVLRAQSAPGENLLSTNASLEPSAVSGQSGSRDDNDYAAGVRAINEGRWSDAIAVFNRLAGQGSSHADGALYWKAYAENKLGQGDNALQTCAELRHSHPGSNWLEDCGALEIEILARNGQPLQPKAQQSDDLKLLALASLMQRDEKKALAEIDEILNRSDSSEKLKQGALYIMGEHHTDTEYAQIARLSFVDGDVRVARGAEDKHHKDATWEVAETNLPLEAGFSLVTGEGRAEIELEDASTLYLAPNSVLTINNLSSTGGIPRTDVGLLSGTVTLHVHPYVFGETFTLHTPTDTIVTRYPQLAFFRATSYTDGMAFTSMGGGTLGIGEKAQELMPGQTLYFKNGLRILEAGPIHPPDFTSWDRWVADRTAARATATAEALAASGLSSPIPGLADLAGQGEFFHCEPYGTCWDPAATSPRIAASGPAPSQPAAEQGQIAGPALSQDAESSVTTPAARNIGFIGPPAVSGVPRSGLAASDEFTSMFNMFPCMPDEVRYVIARNRIAANGQAIDPSAYFFHDPGWTWAVCHSGSWLYRRKHYVWVVGRRHHHPPFHWVKSGRTLAYVPQHPHDVKGHAPINRLGPVFAVNNKDGNVIKPIRIEGRDTLQLLKEPPKEFRTAFFAPLPHSSEPHMEAHALKDFTTAKGVPVRTAGVPITYDRKSLNFMIPHEGMRGGRPVSTPRAISNSGGNLQSHSGMYAVGGSWGTHGGYGGGYHGGVGGGGGAHGGGSTASSSGGGSHAGGGGSSSGGGSVGGGGGGAHH
jgi:hypothetical protein